VGSIQPPTDTRFVLSRGAAYVEKPGGTGTKNIEGPDDVQASGR